MQQQRRIQITPFWRRFARRWLATVVCSLALVTCLSGFGGFAWQYATLTSMQTESSPVGSQQPAGGQDWSIPLYKTVQLFLLNSGAEDDAEHPGNWLLMIARLSASLLFLVVSSTVILSVLDDVRRLPSVLTRRDHVVICGLGRIGLQLLDDLVGQGRAANAVIVEYNSANPWLDYARSMGATVLIGDSTRGSTLDEARVSTAAEVFVVNGDDGVNLEAVAEIGLLLRNSGIDRLEKPLRVYVHVVDTNFASTLRPYCTVLHDSPGLAVQVFNVPRMAATGLVTHQLWPFSPKQDQEVAHYVILGFGAMGQALAVQLVQLAHFPNHKRCRLTIADCEIDAKARCFLSRYPRFTSWTAGEAGRTGVDSFSSAADAWGWNEHPLPAEIRINSPQAIQYACNAEFVELPGGRSDERFAVRLAKRFRGDGVRPVVLICSQQDQDNFEMAVELREQLACEGIADVPLFVWLPRQPALAETFSRSPGGNIVAFGECHSVASYLEITDPIRERVGRKIQQAYEDRMAERASLEGRKYVTNAWSDIPDDHRESNRVAADHMLIKLQHVGVQLVRRATLEDKGGRFTRSFQPRTRRTLAEMEHYRWVTERLLSGWRYIPRGQSDDEIRAYKKRKFNHNITVFEQSEMVKDFDQIDVIYEECQRLDGFILRRCGSVDSTSPEQPGGGPQKQTAERPLPG